MHLWQVAKAPHGEHFVLERAMEALVLAACLRVTWPGMHNPDAKLEQPNLRPVQWMPELSPHGEPLSV